MAGIALNETFGQYFMPLRLGPTARDTLQEFIDIDVSAEDLVRILNRNQAYRDLVYRFVNKKTGNQKSDEKNGDTGPTHRLISLLGMIGSRNLILALRMHKNSEGCFPVNAEGAVDLNANDYLKKAIDIEELFLRNKLGYSETAFAAASYYDWFLRTQQKHPAFKKQEPFLQEIYKRAFRAGLIAHQLATKMPGGTPKFALAAAMLSQVGRMHMALFLGADYTDFEAQIDAIKMSHVSRLLLEREKFGISHEEMGSYSLFYFDVFRDLEPAVRYFREPYCLKGADKSNFTLAMLVSLADSMARSWKIPNDEKDPVFQDWAAPWNKEMRLRTKTLIDVMKTAMSLK